MGALKLVAWMLWLGWLRTKETTAPLVIDNSPTTPLASANRVTVFSWPSAAATPATWVPRIPMVTTGVDTVI